MYISEPNPSSIDFEMVCGNGPIMVESYPTTEVPHSTANAASVNCNVWPPVVTCGSIVVISNFSK